MLPSLVHGLTSSLDAVRLLLWWSAEVVVLIQGSLEPQSCLLLTSADGLERIGQQMRY